MGIVSSIGDNLSEVARALRTGESGLRAEPSFLEAGLVSGVAGVPRLDPASVGDRKLRRYMTEAALYAWVATQEALRQARLGELDNPRIGLIAGSGAGSLATAQEVYALARERGVAKISPYVVPRIMGSNVSACLATTLGIRGAAYGLSSACATSAHCLGHAMEIIQMGKQDVVIAGGAEEVDVSLAMLFDAMGVLATNYNDRPRQACRPFDAAREGFALAGGAAMLVLESQQHAERRGAEILAELSGYGATSDGADMVHPSQEGAERAMSLAWPGPPEAIDYVNAHATGTPRGDLSEARAIAKFFGAHGPLVSSTKGLTGHAIGAVAAQEVVYTLLMMRDGFVAANTNLQEPDPAMPTLPFVTVTAPERIERAMSLSLGFGGANAVLVLERYRP
ncbi:MAG: beta-ketoacyl-ACP synthase I [Betaproteobacteria bacterium]|nr:beta-ketoacyl-ACP synthase I [Betaproteobacteria bacterium]